MKSQMLFLLGFALTLLPGFWVASSINNKSLPACWMAAVLFALGCGWLAMRFGFSKPARIGSNL